MTHASQHEYTAHGLIASAMHEEEKRHAGIISSLFADSRDGAKHLAAIANDLAQCGVELTDVSLSVMQDDGIGCTQLKTIVQSIKDRDTIIQRLTTCMRFIHEGREGTFDLLTHVTGDGCNLSVIVVVADSYMREVAA